MPIPILMPALSPTMTEGNLVKWHKKQGDKVKAGDLLAEIETDKATMEVEAVDGGTLGRILVAEGTENVAVNTPIGLLLEAGESDSALDGFSPAPTAVAAPAPTAPAPMAGPAATPAPTPVAAPQPSGDRIKSSPLARRVAEQGGVDLSQVSGTGPGGRVIKVDVDQAMAAGPRPGVQKDRAVITPAAPDSLFPDYEVVKLSNMRKVIAKRLTESKQNVPHFYLTVDCRLDKLLEARQELNAQLPPEQKISVNDFVIKAMAMAMGDVPEANASWGEDHIKIYNRVDISVAVAIEGGLVTPIVADAPRKSLGQIASEMKDLAARARAGKLRPEEFQGGTISLSNLGMFGISNFAAVINPPQGCILAVGAGEKRPVIEGDKVVVATVMTCTLSVDHRVVDGAMGANYLKAFKAYVENPVRMLI